MMMPGFSALEGVVMVLAERWCPHAFGTKGPARSRAEGDDHHHNSLKLRVDELDLERTFGLEEAGWIILEVISQQDHRRSLAMAWIRLT